MIKYTNKIWWMQPEKKIIIVTNYLWNFLISLDHETIDWNLETVKNALKAISSIESKSGWTHLNIFFRWFIRWLRWSLTDMHCFWGHSRIWMNLSLMIYLVFVRKTPNFIHPFMRSGARTHSHTCHMCNPWMPYLHQSTQLKRSRGTQLILWNACIQNYLTLFIRRYMYGILRNVIFAKSKNIFH